MKVGILAGGLGTRFAEATKQKPKALIEIGGKPIIWHVMKHYERFVSSEFVIATGYRKEELVRYFVDYHRTSSSVSVALKYGAVTTHARWGSGLARPSDRHRPDTMTGGRIKRLAPLSGQRDLHADLGRRGLRRRPRRAAGVPPVARQARDGDRGAAARPIRPHRASTATRSPSSPRSPSTARAGSTAPSSCSSPASSTTSTATRRSGSASRCERLAERRPADGLPPRSRSGSAWTPSATRSCSKSCGPQGKPPWRSWE